MGFISGIYLRRMAISGWCKIEQGNRRITVDILVKANKLLNHPLDFRYYFSEMSYEEALNKDKTYNDMVKSIENIEKKINPINDLDNATKAVYYNDILKSIVELIRNYDDTTLTEIKGMIKGLMYNEKKRSGSKTA